MNWPRSALRAVPWFLACCALVVAWGYSRAYQRERRRVVEVVQMLDLTKHWLRQNRATIATDDLPPGYETEPLEDSTPHGRPDAARWVLLSAPVPPAQLFDANAEHFGEYVFGHLYGIYVDENGRFVDVGWTIP